MYVDPFMLILQIISFLILLWLLAKFLYKPFMKYLDERARDVRKLIETAEEDRKKAEEHLEASKEELRKTRETALKIKESAAHEADREKIKTIDETKKEALEILERTELDLKKEIEKAKESVKKDISSLSLEMAKKILGREIKEKDHKKLIKESLKELSRER